MPDESAAEHCRGVTARDLALADPPFRLMHAMYRSARPAWLWDDEVHLGAVEPAPTVAEYVLMQLVNTPNDWPQRLETGIYERDLRDVILSFPSLARVCGKMVGERPGLALMFDASDPDEMAIGMAGLRLWAAPDLPRDRIPAWAWEACGGWGTFTGVFLEEHRRRQPDAGEG
jgi:hypothetical protein